MIQRLLHLRLDQHLGFQKLVQTRAGAGLEHALGHDQSKCWRCCELGGPGLGLGAQLFVLDHTVGKAQRQGFRGTHHSG